MSGANSLHCTPLPWDSAFFGVPIAQLPGRQLTAASAEAALAWCRHERVACLYFLADPADPVTVQTAARQGFDLVDLRITLALEAPGLSEGLDDPRVRPARAADCEALECIARSAHTDSRFYFDGRFRRERCDELYAVWIRRSWIECPEGVLVAWHDGRPAGYLTCSMTGDAGRIGLVGVAPFARGHGLGTSLVSAGVRWFGARQARSVTVITQGRNLRAQALYQRQGFITSGVELWYHRWFGGDASD